jgi:hypothetical protein
MLATNPPVVRSDAAAIIAAVILKYGNERELFQKKPLHKDNRRAPERSGGGAW